MQRAMLTWRQCSEKDSQNSEKKKELLTDSHVNTWFIICSYHIKVLPFLMGELTLKKKKKLNICQNSFMLLLTIPNPNSAINNYIKYCTIPFKK